MSVYKEARNYTRGQVAITVVISFLIVSLVIGAGLASLGLRQTQSSNISIKSLTSSAAAESGLDDVLLRISRGMSVDSTETLSVGGGTVETVTTDIDNDKEVRAEGDMANIIRRTKALISGGPGVEYNFGVQVGQGGFCMDNNSAVISNVYASGDILGPGAGGCDRSGGSGTASITGNASVANGHNDDPDDEEDDYDQTLIFGKTSPTIDIAQQFRLDAAGPAGRLWIFLRKVGDPGPLEVRVVRNVSGSPSNNPNDVLARETIPVEEVVHFYTFVDVFFATSTPLLGNTDYWFILDAPAANATNYYEVGQDSGSGSGQKYTANSANPSAVWNELSGRDLNFKIWRGSVLHKIDNMDISEQAWAHTIDDSNVGGDALAFSLLDSEVTGSVYAHSISNCTIQQNAHYNTKSGCTISGNQVTPTTPPSDPPLQPLALISPLQLEFWRDEAKAGGTYSGSCPYRPANGAVIGPLFVPCDLEIRSNRTVTFAGPVWVIGNIILESNSIAQLHPSFGPLSGALVGEFPLGGDDHKHIDIQSDAVICGSEGYNDTTNDCNAGNGSYMHFIYINEPLLTSIHVNSNVEGRAVFYDPHGRIKIHSGAQVHSVVVGYEFYMYSNSLLDFETNLQSVGFMDGPPGVFLIKDWRATE